MTRELQIVQSRLARRENQLKEAAVQLGKLQIEWKASQKNLLDSRDYYKNQNIMCTKVGNTQYCNTGLPRF